MNASPPITSTQAAAHQVERAEPRVSVDRAKFESLIDSRMAAPRTARVAAARTPISGAEAAEALRQAWVEVTGKPASDATTAVLTAQWAHETGRGASMYNYNFGGIKGRGPGGLSVQLKTREGWGASERHIVDGFRAYRTAKEGAVDYVKLLTQRYSQAVSAAEQGDAAGFVRGLKANGYFTGNETAYTHSVSGLTKLALADGFASLGQGGPLPSEVARLVPSGGGREVGLPPEVNYPAGAPFVDAMTIADEISRAALRIAAQNERERTSST